MAGKIGLKLNVIIVLILLFVSSVIVVAANGSNNSDNLNDSLKLSLTDVASDDFIGNDTEEINITEPFVADTAGDNSLPNIANETNIVNSSLINQIQQESNQTVNDLSGAGVCSSKDVVFGQSDVIFGDVNGVSAANFDKDGISVSLVNVDVSNIGRLEFSNGIFSADSVSMDYAIIKVPYCGISPVVVMPKLYIRESGEDFSLAIPYEKNNKTFNKIMITGNHYIFEVEHFTDYTVGNGQNYSTLESCLLATTGSNDRCIVATENYSETLSSAYVIYNNSIGVSANNITIDCGGSYWYGDGSLHWFYTDVGFNNITLSNCRQHGYDIGYVLRGGAITLNNAEVNSSVSQSISANSVNNLVINNSLLKGKILLNDVTGGDIINTTIKYQSGQFPSIDANYETSGINLVGLNIENNPEGHGIGMQDAVTDLLVENSTVNDTISAGKISIINSIVESADGNLVDYMTTPSDIFIKNSLLDCQNSGFTGVTFTNLDNLTVEGNIIGNCTYAIYSENSYDLPASVFIRNNVFDSNNGSVYFNNNLYNTYIFEIVNNTFRDLKPQTLSYGYYTTNSPRRYNSVDYDYNSGTHYLWFPAGNYQEVTADDTALNPVFDGTQNLSLCMMHLTSPLDANVTGFGRMSEFSEAQNYSDWCSGVGYSCSCDYFRPDFVIANSNGSDYAVQSDTNLTVVSGYANPHIISYSALPNFYNLRINTNSVIQNNTFFSNISVPFDVYVKNSNFTINNLLSNGVKSVANNSFCIDGDGNFYKEGLTPQSGDCGPANITFPADGGSYGGTINITWKKQSGGNTINYSLFYSNDSVNYYFINSTLGLNYLWAVPEGDSIIIKLVPSFGGYNATNDNVTIVRKKVDVHDLSRLHNVSVYNVFEFMVKNNDLLNNTLSWMFMPGSSQVNITSVEDVSLVSNETVFVYVEMNYTSSGVYNVTAYGNTTAGNDSEIIEVVT